MTRSISRWTTALAAVALLTTPIAALGQTPTGQPPTSTGQPPAGTASSTPEQPQAGAPANPDQARQHLTAARNSLSELAQLPAAAQLTGDARTQISQLITNFNELITTPSNWRATYAKVEANLTALVGDATTDESAARTTGVAGAVGTSGMASGLDPAIRAKLVEFRTHLDKFEEAAGGGPSAADPAASSNVASGTSAAGTSATTGTAASGTSATGTTPPASATGSPAPATQEPLDADALLRHVTAIEAILAANNAATATGTTGTTAGTAAGTAATHAGVTLTPEQISQLRNHLTELRRLLGR